MGDSQKTGDMAVGQVSFHNDKKVLRPIVFGELTG